MIRGALFLSILFALNLSINAQDRREADFLLMFYNTENLFDYFNDPSINDEEFLPTSKRHWTKERYNDKLNKLAKVILSTNPDPPAIVGMAEVENYKVLKDLVNISSLNKFDYHIIHFDSPDSRGIDVAAIYRPDKLKILSTKSIRIIFPSGSKSKTRDILYIQGLAGQKDTLHIYFNHWPSRRGGKKASDNNRNWVASQLKQNIDSLLKISVHAKILVAGDFNDEPDDESVSKVLKSIPADAKPEKYKGLINLSIPWLKDASYRGTHYFKGKWGILDQIMVSNSVLEKKGLYCSLGSASIYYEDFLLKDDHGFGGKSPFRTYTGMKYTGGFSDHLPILLKMHKN